MKQIKLRRVNSKKYCRKCEEIVEMVMEGLNGYCPNEDCRRKLFTLNSKIEK